MVEPQTQNKKYSKLAVASFAFSILIFLAYVCFVFIVIQGIGKQNYTFGHIGKIVLLFGLLILFSLPFILGIISLKNIKKNTLLKGKAFAITGIIIGILLFTMQLLIILLSILTPNPEKYITHNQSLVCASKGGVCGMQCPEESIIPDGKCPPPQMCCKLI